MNMQSILSRSFWVFDLDGTLTVPAHDFALIRKRLDIPEDADILGFIASRPEDERLRLRTLLDEIEVEICAQARPARGVARLMDVLHSRGARMGILTRNTREVALRTLATIGIESYFHHDAILGRDEAAPKPDPDGLFRLGSLWDVTPSEMVMAGDYLFDLEAGRAAGAGTIHIDPTSRFRWPHLADVTVGTPEALAVLVGSCA